MFNNPQKQLSPLSIALIALGLCFIRWVFIANGYDYGWDYETGYRVYSGGVYGRDFYTALGPLSYQIIGQLFHWVGPRWFILYPFYYLFWSLSIIGVLVIFRTLTQQKEILAIAAMGVIPVSIPHISALHLYNCLGYCLAVWCSAFFFMFFKSDKKRYLINAGVLGALAVFTKQNLGLGAIGLNTLLLFVHWLHNPKKKFQTLILSSAFLLFPFLLVVSLEGFYFSKEIGVGELQRLMFSDAAQAKGNLFNMLKVAVPRISFGHSERHDFRWLIQHVAELGSYIFIAAANLFVFQRFIKSHPKNEQPSEKKFLLKDVMIVFGLFLFLLILPLWLPELVLKVREKYFWFNENKRISAVIMPFLFWAILGNLAFCFFFLWKQSKSFFQENIYFVLIAILAVGMNVLVCASKFLYLFLNMPLLLGFLLITVLHLGWWSRRQLFLALGFLWGLAYLFYPTHALGPMVRLNGENVQGLLFGKSEREFVEFYTEKVKPWVENKQTLWLIHGGPHSLSGAIPVRNVSNLYFDQFNLRIEESLVKGWMANPPEMIVMDWFVAPENSVWLTGQVFKDWLEKKYVQVAFIDHRKVLKRLP